MKLAIVTSHPIQYYAPWFRHLAQQHDLELKVFYLWNFGVTQQVDRQFQQSIQWDIPLLQGYDYEWVDNVSQHPGTSHFWGLQNPSLSRQVAAYEPDAVLMMNYNYASLYRFIFTWNRCPLLFRGDSHRIFPSSGIKAWAKQCWISMIYQRFQALLYVGQGNYDYFRDHAVPAERLFHCPHGIDNDRFCQSLDVAQSTAPVWKQELGIPADHRVILFAGKFIEKKRPLDLLAAFAQLQSEQGQAPQQSKISLLFVGAGPLESQLREQTKGLPGVYFAPFQNQSQMPRTYGAADLFVLPSYGSGETWGLAVNEAMVMGKAIIVSDHVGCAADLIQPGQNGLVFKAGDRGALAQALGQALSSTEQLRHWGQASQHRIQGFSYDQMTQGLIKALAQVTG